MLIEVMVSIVFGIFGLILLSKLISLTIVKLFKPFQIIWQAKRRAKIAKAELEAAKLEAETCRIQLLNQRISDDVLNEIINSDKQERKVERK